MSYSIAIDGPAGAGKSTIAKKVAKVLNFIYVDTGAMYRAMGIFLIRKGILPEQDTAGRQEEIGRFCQDADISITYQNGEQVVLLGGENVNTLIRTEEAGKMASVVGTNGLVREKLVALQRELAKTKDVVMDGRDIGTCVLPFADVKVYLTASSRVRAERRHAQLTARGERCDRDEIEKDIIDRDRQDMTREISPLKKADDAVLLDSSDKSIEEVVEEIIALYQKESRKEKRINGNRSC